MKVLSEKTLKDGSGQLQVQFTDRQLVMIADHYSKKHKVNVDPGKMTQRQVNQVFVQLMQQCIKQRSNKDKKKPKKDN